MLINTESELYLSVTNTCTLACVGCCTEKLRALNPGFELEIKDLEKFLMVTKLSNYKFRRLIIVGLGEPTMWTHLEEGLKIIKKYKNQVFDTSCLITNGFNLERLDSFIGKEIDEVYLSIYPETYDRLIEQATDFRDRNPENFFFSYEANDGILDERRIIQNFLVFDAPDEILPEDGFCVCPGTLYHDGYIYPLCGKGFSASLLDKYGDDIRMKLVPDYLKGTYLADAYREENTNPCTFEACRSCGCNSHGYENGIQPQFKHKMSRKINF